MDTFRKKTANEEMLVMTGSMIQSGRAALRVLSLGLMMLALQFGLDFFHSSWLVGGQIALAQTATQDPRPKRDVPAMSSETYEKLAKFIEIMLPEDKDGNPIPPEELGELDLPAAKKILDNLLARHRRLNENEMAQVHRNYAWLAQEMDDMELALEHLKKILDYREHITYAMEESTLKHLSGIYHSFEDYESALDYIMQYMDLSISEGSNDYVYVSQIYIALEDYENTKIWINLAISTAEEQQKTIKEHWYQILLLAVNILEQWDEVLEVNKVCVVKWPKKEYWMGMAQAYMQLEEDNNALYSLECAHTAGLLDDERGYTNYASMLAIAGVPIRAARILEESFENEIVKQDLKSLKWLAQYYQLSSESELAIDTYIQGAEFAEDGDIWGRIAQLYNQTGQFEKCIEAVTTALDLGVSKRINHLWSTKGSCQFSAEKYDAAKTTFTDLRRELLRSDDEGNEALLGITRSFLKSIENELNRIAHEADVAAAERAYEEEKRKRS